MDELLVAQLTCRVPCSSEKCRADEGLDFTRDCGLDLSPENSRLLDDGLLNTLDTFATLLTFLGISNEEGSQRVVGKAATTVTLVRIQWPWTSYPIAVNLAGMLFLLVTRRRSGQPKLLLWEDSLWPLLFRGLEYDVRIKNNNVRHMNEMARSIEIQLRPDSDGRLALGK